MGLVYLFVGLVVGLALGAVFFERKRDKSVSGYLKQANDEGDTYLFLELKSKPEQIMSKDYVIFKVDKEKIIPR